MGNSLPYSQSRRKPESAEAEARGLLQKFGCDEIGIRVPKDGDTQLYFKHKGLSVRCPIRTQGYYDALYRQKSKRGRIDKNRLKSQAASSSWALALDWLKSTLMLVDLNMMTFEQAFMSHVMIRGDMSLGEMLQPKLLQLTEGENPFGEDHDDE